MPLRRLFLLGAAAVVSAAALVAIVAVVKGDFGETEGKIFGTLAATLVAGATAITGVALLERRLARPLGLAGVALAAAGFLVWAEQIWAKHSSDAYWKLLLLLLIWGLATLIVTTARLLIRSAALLRTAFAGTGAAAALAAALATTMVLREQGDGWQLFAVLVILAVLGLALIPILERYQESGVPGAPPERVLGTVGDAVVLAATLRGRRVVVLDGREVALDADESVLVRLSSAQ